MPEPVTDRRSDYRHFLEIPTRWKDVDMYRHVNNVVYYSYFDTVINAYLIREGGFDPVGDEVVGVCAESMCRFLHELAFPETIDAGLRVGRIGRSSVRYEIGLFRQSSDEPAACGHFVHVFVDRASNNATPIPDAIRGALEKLA
jgi:acyl-CoA thioester hydrolase